MFFYRSNDERVDELNRRIHSRLNPSSVAPMSFSPRPVSTKYALFPMLDGVAKTETRIDSKEVPVFLPADSAPFAGFNVQQESQLLLKHTLQRDSAASYFPKSTSDLFRHELPATKGVQPHPYLFAQVQGYTPPRQPTPLVFNNVRLKTKSSRK
jgi:hypothetical protein